MKILLVGASGLVGQYVLQMALDDQRVESVVAPSRSRLPTHPKLLAPVIDFDHLPVGAPWWRTDAVICTLGTTMKQAQSPEAFKRVDYEYPLAIARLAQQHGATTYALNSAIGANMGSRFFYNRVKGELEHDLAALGFFSLTYVRPGVIAGRRMQVRQSEWMLVQLFRVLGPVLPRRLRINPARNIAKVLLESALSARPGVHVVTSAQLT
ncbi:NAD-dependent dehydratase [Acerihabitans sp. TG2]|uniref:NAD-dependent dehydratase n=1 Tax=Acerihabitans sp. TG2 TaxID=3096008 RepID=UPI002B2306EE|nr:NAD-dependent dehydratase [Acerihabitans sp. TG2]MEA9391223.1 NAD-dependent dehydratase [Acerihabitans sp. TG2]